MVVIQWRQREDEHAVVCFAETNHDEDNDLAEASKDNTIPVVLCYRGGGSAVITLVESDCGYGTGTVAKDLLKLKMRMDRSVSEGVKHVLADTHPGLGPPDRRSPS